MAMQSHPLALIQDQLLREGQTFFLARSGTSQPALEARIFELKGECGSGTRNMEMRKDPGQSLQGVVVWTRLGL